VICLERVNTKSDARAVILQCLCEYDLVDHDIVPVMSRVFDSSVFTNEATLFSKLIIEKIQENKIEIDQIISSNAPTWPIDQLPTVDRNILRLALTEIIWIQQAPSAVVINEAVELAKIFGSEGSSKFVNGVLGSYVKNN